MTGHIQSLQPVCRPSFIPERDKTPPHFNWSTREEVRTYCLEQGVVDSQYRLQIPADEALPPIDLPLNPPPHFDAIQKKISLPYRIFLRGSKAAQLIGPEKFFSRLLGCLSSSLPFIQHDPQDEDWLFALELDPLPDQLYHLRKDLETLPFTKKPFIPERNTLVHHSSAFILGTIESSDFVIGRLESRHLFLRDAFAIELDPSGSHRILSEHFWQAVIDHTLGIVRLETRHEQDFYAFLAAIEQATKGALIIEEETTLSTILSQFSSLTPEWIVYGIKKRLEHHQIDPLAFLYNVCSHLDLRAERVWQQGFDAVRPLAEARFSPFSWALLHFLKEHPLPFQALRGAIQWQHFLPAERPSAEVNPHLNRFLQKEQLLAHLENHLPSAVNPYPLEWIRALRRLHHENALSAEEVERINSYPGIRLERTQTEELIAFATGELNRKEKRELQRKLGLESTTEWLPEDLFKRVLKSPSSVSEPLVLFDYCTPTVKRDLVQTEEWQQFLTARFTPDALFTLLSFLKAPQLVNLLLIPKYQEYLKDYLEEVLKSQENKSSLPKNYFYLLFDWIRRFPEKGTAKIADPSFYQLAVHKNFNEPFDKALADLLKTTAHIAPLFPLFAKRLESLDQLGLSCEQLCLVKAVSAVQLMDLPGREIEAVLLFAPLLKHLEMLPPEIFWQFIQRLILQLPLIRFTEERDWEIAQTLISWEMNHADREVQRLILDRLMESPLPHVKAQGLRWNLQHMELFAEVVNFSTVYAHFQCMRTLPKESQDPFRLPFISSPLLQREWTDEKFPFIIFHCLFNDLTDPKSSLSDTHLLHYLQLHGARLLADLEIAVHLKTLVKKRLLQHLAQSKHPEAIQLLYITLSALLLNGRNYPKEDRDPTVLFLQLRKDTAKDPDLADFSTQLFQTFKEKCEGSATNSAFCFVLFNYYLQSVLKQFPSPPHRELFFLFLNWIFYHDSLLPEGAILEQAAALIALGEQCGFYDPETLAIHQLMTLQEPAPNTSNALSILLKISELKCNHDLNPERKMLKILHMVQYLLKGQSQAPKAIAATHLYDQIRIFHLAVFSSTIPPFPEVLKKIKDCMRELLQLKVQIPLEMIQAIKRIELLSKQ